jgi:abhydrolase domain-containing protein 14
VASSEKVVLLLHGAAFTSQTWVSEVPTIASLAAMGHKVVAVDLPGFGKTKAGVSDKGLYLDQVFNALIPNAKPMVVSPSMSGSFIVPFLKDNSNKISGWVPVAPAGLSSGQEFFPTLNVPTMIVYGELDPSGKKSGDVLSLIPTSTQHQVLPGAKHPAYLDQPDLWHKLLYNFMKLL